MTKPVAKKLKPPPKISASPESLRGEELYLSLLNQQKQKKAKTRG